MIKQEPVANLISWSKTFVWELLNPRSFCKPEQSAVEKSSFFTSSTFFNQPNGVTGTSVISRSRDAVCWSVFGLEISIRWDILIRWKFWHCVTEWLQPLHIFVKQFTQILTCSGTVSVVGRPRFLPFFHKARRTFNPFSFATEQICKSKHLVILIPSFSLDWNFLLLVM